MGTPESAPAKGGAGRRLSSLFCSPTTFPWFLDMLGSFRSFPPLLGAPGTPHTSSGVWCSLTLLCFSKIYLNSSRGVCPTVRHLGSIWVCCVWNVLTLHKFVRTEDYINQKLRRKSPSCAHPNGPAKCSGQEPFQSKFMIQWTNPETQFQPWKWDMLSFHSHICRAFFFFSFFFLSFFNIFCPGVYALTGLVLHCKVFYIDKRTSGETWKIS